LVASDTFYRLTKALGLRVELQGTIFCLYRGDHLLTTGSGADALYKWMRSAYTFRLPAADEIQMAKSLLKPKVEKELKKQLKGRAKEIAKDKARTVARYPWLK
jgi:hypothetical protein